MEPKQIWAYDEPCPFGNLHVERTEEEILEEYFPYWSSQMREIGKAYLICNENCIDDWIVINCAYKVV